MKKGQEGLFRVRHYLNDALRSGGGHIGYGIRDKYRGRGYATKGLALTIEKARELVAEDELYLSVHKDNPASLRVQEKTAHTSIIRMKKNIIREFRWKNAGKKHKGLTKR